MGIECERKFLVTDDVWSSFPFVEIRQGYLSLDPHRSVRVRVAGPQGFLTVKGMGHGWTRQEFEYEIPLEDARKLLALCTGAVIEKRRRRIHHRGRDWDVDEFLGDNRGLVLAEIEIADETDVVEVPPWAGMEVSGDPKYYNASLAVNPFRKWP